MLSFEREIVQLREQGLLSSDAAAILIARERREIVSVHPETRAMAWLGVMMIASGVGVLVSKNLDKIGPLAIAIAIGLASAGCYAWSGVRRSRIVSGTLDPYVLLLGALLLSADAGFIESQWHLLGPEWPRHFLVLAVVHGVTAYVFESQALLSLAIAAIASWLGVERTLDTFFTSEYAMAERAFTCAAIVAVWRTVNRRADFVRVFDHFIANLLMWGGLILTFNGDTRYLGAFLVLAFAGAAIGYGFAHREEWFVLYSFIYAVIAVDVVIADVLHEPVIALMFVLMSSIAAVVSLFVIHARFRRAFA